MDTRATTASVKVTREFGNISSEECKRYQRDRAAVERKEMSFGDFFTGLKNRVYSRPVSQTANGEFCEQLEMDEELASTITDFETFQKNEGKIKGIRIRKVTGGGSFSSSTKAKLKLSLPIRARYVSEIKNGRPVMKEIVVRSMAIYHPSPVRIENVQHDAVLSLNDPSDEVAGEDTVILIPLMGGNTGAPSETFLSKVVPHIASLAVLDPTTGLYPAVDIPTGSDWNLKDVFWLGPPDGDGYAPVQDSYYSWDGLPTFNRSEAGRLPGRWSPNEFWRAFYPDATYSINYGWKDSGSKVRYFMMGSPASISMTDLSILTREFPPTPAEQAIHAQPDETATYPKVLGAFQPTPPGWPPAPIVYKAAEGNALGSQCCGDRAPVPDQPVEQPSFEGFTNPGNPNLRQGISPSFIMTLVFGLVTFIFMAVGAWIALYLIHRDYDYAWTTFSTNAGKVVGAIIKKLSPPSVGLFATVKKSIPQMINAGAGKLQGAAPMENGLSLLKGPGAGSGLLGKLKV